MQESITKAGKKDSKLILPFCFVLGLFGFLITWKPDVSNSGIIGFFLGILIPFSLYVIIELIRKREKRTTNYQIKSDKISINESIQNDEVEIKITIPKKLLNSKDDV